MLGSVQDAEDALQSTTISCNRITVSGTIRCAGAFENVIVAILGVERSRLMVLGRVIVRSFLW
jgi:hypothetical protein